MGQDEILKFLKKNDKWFTIKEISEKIGGNMSNNSRSLNVLFKNNEVFRKEVKGKDSRHRYFYRYNGK